MQCPHCTEDTLVEKSVKDKDVRVDACPDCGGVWFDRDELARLMAVAAKELHVLDDSLPSERLCPRCLREMFVFDYPQTYVTVDMCGHCRGLWLDAGEAKEIKAVRKYRNQKGELDEYAPVTGIKGELLTFIDRAMQWAINI